MVPFLSSVFSLCLRFAVCVFHLLDGRALTFGRTGVGALEISLSGDPRSNSLLSKHLNVHEKEAFVCVKLK